jgi:4-amino-4-deoxy-L-arabinose transferase-like glycosyltransferase
VSASLEKARPPEPARSAGSKDAVSRPGRNGDAGRAGFVLSAEREVPAIGVARLSSNRENTGKASSRLAPLAALGAILAVAALLRGWNLAGGGVIVPYYFAGVRSMLQSWHNLFFNAFDPAGFVSVDKPPIAFWLQTLSAKFFGFGTASILLPQVVEGVASVGLLYWLVRRRFGVAAGLLAALFLALSPADVAVDRSNNTESCLVLVLLLAAWALIRAVETGRLGPLLLAALLVGIGFNVKMLVAFGVVPAFALVYLCGAPIPPWRRVGRLAAAAIVLAPAALSWSLVYDLTPASERPYVDSTDDNSMLELVVGHNFVQRFVRPAGYRQRAAAASATSPDSAAAAVQGRDFAPAGPLRLAAPPLAAQIGWLFPLALIGGTAAWRRHRRAPQREDWQLAMWGGWALAYGAVFSAAGGLFHAYYLTVMAPALCALAGTGAIALWGLYRERGIAALWLPGAILATALWQVHIVEGYLGGVLAVGHVWLPLALLGSAAMACAALVWRRGPALPAAAAALAVLLAMPAAWSVGTAATRATAGFPSAQPPFMTGEAATRRGRFAMIAGALAGDPKLIAFLSESRRNEEFLLAAVNARLAAPIIIATGDPVMALGGFAGRDPILGVDDFARLVTDQRVRFALIGEGSQGLRRVFGEGHQKELIDWIRANGKPVDPTLWRSIAPEDRPRSAEAANTELYDLRPPAPGS